ncbi:MAG: UDP-N-acetylglucosamine 2-epimerase (non-hydrolyzing) [Acidimicrobiia bacterium]|nr:UDP-N-acetylglucosamine 2-epimerase (non-hydrolyzing) [Acidimicrobiia bacterium]
MVVFGTRPEAIKLAPVILALAGSQAFEPVVVVTAQHREMLDQVLETFGIVPARDLDISKDRQTLTDVTVRGLQRLTPLLEQDAPDAVVVQGDTTTTFVGALAAFYHRVPVVHVEAGLRTGDPYSPYPEEINRRLTTQVTSLHLAPTRTAKRNLLAEGVDESRVVVTGNTVIDALLWTVDRDAGTDDADLEGVGLDGRRLILVTAHRRESWGPGLASVGRALATIAGTEPDVDIVFPIHRNPRVREAIVPALHGLPNVRLLEPLPYAPFARLMRRAHLIVTDSGGIQEEGPSLGKPVLVMRDSTERPEAISAGTVRLIGTDEHAMAGAVRTLLHDEAAYAAMATAVNPYGDGHAARRTVEALLHFFALGPPAEEFDAGGAG